MSPQAKNSNEMWDLDNLIKPALGAIEGLFGVRPWKGLPLPADDQVEHIEATKRTVEPYESPGAAIQLWTLHSE